MEVTDTDLTIHMVTILVDAHTGVDNNQQVTNKIITLIDTNHTVLGVLEVMGHNMVTVVLEVVKVSS